MPGQPGILVRDTLLCVEYQQHDVGLLHRLQRLDHTELLYHLADARATAHTRRIDQRVSLSIALERDIDTVSGRTGLIECHHPVFTEEPVHQGRLAHVGPAYHRDLYTLLVTRTFRLIGHRQRFQNSIDQTMYPAAMRGGNRDRLAQPQGEEITTDAVVIEALGLVDHDGDRFTGATQSLCDDLVAARKPFAPVEDEQHPVRLADRQLHLLFHQHFDALPVTAYPAGIDHHVGLRAQAPYAVLAITRQPGLIGNQGITGSGKPVEQGGFPNIGTSNQRDHRKHYRS